MKHLSIATFILLISLISYAQTSLDASISLDRMNVVYTTLPNPISVNLSVPWSDIECSINKNGTLEKRATGRYDVIVKEEGDYEFKITQKSTGATFTSLLRAKKLPTPVAKFNNIIGDSISTDELAKVTQLDLSYIPSFDWNIRAEVISFSILKISATNKRTELNNSTGIFSLDTKGLINTCAKGDILIFKNIKAIGVDPSELKVKDFIIYIK